ncbi:MAG TPA: thioredoxin family protein [Bacteroidota bacterium]|nr:thioredoxin family protein [Bacteroidota bacterium]
MTKMLFLTLCLALAVGTAVAQPAAQSTSPQKPRAEAKPLVTFVELGSVKCIPCQQMQPIMASVEKKYGNQLSVVFHDVWKSDQRQYAEKYEIRVIPTQVFLDKDGKEFFRHEGFFPESEIDKLLQKRGLTPRKGD